jgi:hypothetical protein
MEITYYLAINIQNPDIAYLLKRETYEKETQLNTSTFMFIPVTEPERCLYLPGYSAL